MATSKANVLKAINLIKETEEDLHALLKDSPDLQMRADNVLKRLRNGFAHTVGIAADTAEEKPIHTGIELTHIGGIPYTPPKASVKVTAATPSAKESDEFQGFIDAAFEDFQVLEASELKDNYNDLVVRAVAVKAGMKVTPTEPKVIDIAFIETIKAAVAKKAEEIAIAAESTGKKEVVIPPVKKK